MFDFEKLDVYKKAKIFNSDIRKFIKPRNQTAQPTTNLEELLSALF